MLAAAQEVKNTSLKNLKDVRAYTNLPVLSSIPLLENALLVRRKRRLVWLAWSSALIVGCILMSGCDVLSHFGAVLDQGKSIGENEPSTRCFAPGRRQATSRGNRGATAQPRCGARTGQFRVRCAQRPLGERFPPSRLNIHAGMLADVAVVQFEPAPGIASAGSQQFARNAGGRVPHAAHAPEPSADAAAAAHRRSSPAPRRPKARPSPP